LDAVDRRAVAGKDKIQDCQQGMKPCANPLNKSHSAAINKP
jgi:hypothetical protein